MVFGWSKYSSCSPNPYARRAERKRSMRNRCEYRMTSGLAGCSRTRVRSRMVRRRQPDRGEARPGELRRLALQLPPEGAVRGAVPLEILQQDAILEGHGGPRPEPGHDRSRRSKPV